MSGNSPGAERVNQPHGCAFATGQVFSEALLENFIASLLMCSPDLGGMLSQFSHAAESTFPTFVLVLCLCHVVSDEQI